MPLCSLALVAFLRGPTEAPTSEPELPSWEEAPVVELQPAHTRHTGPLPRDGGPAIVLGSAAIGVGLILIAGSIPLALTPSSPTGLDVALGVTGGLLVAGGGGLLAGAVITRKKFRKTSLGSAADAPPTSRGMRAGAITMMVGGVSAMITGSVLDWRSESFCFESCLPRSSAYEITIGAGLTTLLAGTALLIVSEVRANRYREWWGQREATVRPSFAIGPQGVQVGLGGRF